MHEFAGSIPAEGMFSEKYLRLELSHVQIHGCQESSKGKPKTVHRSDYKGVYCISWNIKSTLNTLITIKMATSTMVTPTTNISYYRGVTEYHHIIRRTRCPQAFFINVTWVLCFRTRVPRGNPNALLGNVLWNISYERPGIKPLKRSNRKLFVSNENLWGKYWQRS